MSTLEAIGPNAAQIEFWNGDVGTAWADNSARMDELLEPLSRATLNALDVRRGERVLDVGCGCGDTTLRLATAGAKPTGIDISEPMLSRARQRATERRLAADFVLADATTHPFEPVFDALFSRFGVMFFADPIAAFANLRRALVANGRLTFVCWQEPRLNTWMALPMSAARPHLPEQPPVDPRAPGPFAFADRSYLTDVLTRAGFSAITIDPLETPLSLGRSVDEAVTFTVKMGPVSRALQTAEPDARERAIAAVTDALRREAKSDGIHLGARCWIVRARNRAQG